MKFFVVVKYFPLSYLHVEMETWQSEMDEDCLSTDKSWLEELAIMNKGVVETYQLIKSGEATEVKH